MKRAEFLKKFGIGIAGIIVVPKMTADAVTFKNKNPELKVTPLNSKENPTEGLIPSSPKMVSTHCRKPCLRDECQDEKGRWWFVKARENRIYDKYDHSIITLIPLHGKRNIHGIYPEMQRVPIGWLHQKFPVIRCANE